MRARFLVCIVLAACGSKAEPKHPNPNDQTIRDTPKPPDTTGTETQTTPAAAAKIGVALQVEPAEADVMIDDLVVGKASQLDPVFALAPGLHTLVITLKGYKTYRMEFSVTDKTESFTIHLDKK